MGTDIRALPRSNGLFWATTLISASSECQEHSIQTTETLTGLYSGQILSPILQAEQKRCCLRAKRRSRAVQSGSPHLIVINIGPPEPFQLCPVSASRSLLPGIFSSVLRRKTFIHHYVIHHYSWTPRFPFFYPYCY